MSSGSQEKRADLLGELVRDLRQFTGLGASFFRAAARIGMTVTDLQIMDILESTGPSTAGQLADLTGLTTGAITGMLNRLEEARLVCISKAGSPHSSSMIKPSAIWATKRCKETFINEGA